MSTTVDMAHPCGSCAFYEESVWQPVDPGAMSILMRGFSRKSLAADQLVFGQDDESQGVYCVSAGLIALRTHHPNGSSTLLKLAYPGDIIGFRSFLANAKHKTEARALLPSRVCLVAHRDANNVVRGNPRVLERLAVRCLTEIDANQDRIIATATTSNKQRLFDLLQQLMATHGERADTHMRMRLPLSRSDLADLIGVQPETLSRLITRLQQGGAFIVSGRDIQMPIALGSRMSA
jgi:CRP/FNR family transcriptional regulator